MTFRIHPAAAIGEVHLKVTNLARSTAFYRDVVGLKPLAEEGRTATLTADGVRPLVYLHELPDGAVTPRRSAAGLYHFAILVPDRAALGRSLRNLIASGIHIGQADHLVSEALYISDPDHNGIEIYADRPRSEWTRDANGDYVMAVDPIDWDGLLSEAGDEPWTGLPEGTTIGHIHLHVSDLDRSGAFYCDVLGFDLEARMDRSALFVAAGGYHHHIGLNVWAGVGVPLAPANATGLAYYTIVLPEDSALREVVQRLQDAGIAVEHLGEQWITHDPSGIELRLHR
ncbi:VOC family protein [Paenibacillus sp. HJGM_3]|uniref:VOC family protein n=1 Tax=Paenibacillus sp. HJGM_3 TaxID=3379816 RepID=UPI00385E3582